MFQNGECHLFTSQLIAHPLQIRLGFRNEVTAPAHSVPCKFDFRIVVVDMDFEALGLSSDYPELGFVGSVEHIDENRSHPSFENEPHVHSTHAKVEVLECNR